MNDGARQKLSDGIRYTLHVVHEVFLILLVRHLAHAAHLSVTLIIKNKNKNLFLKLISEFLMDTWDEVCFVFSTREEMKSLQEAFQKQLNEAAEKAEKQQATVSLCPFSNF